jgi:hypothetical protein
MCSNLSSKSDKNTLSALVSPGLVLRQSDEMEASFCSGTV